MKIETIEQLNEVLKQISGITKKLAEKISTFLLNASDEFISLLVSQIKNLKNNIQYCSNCNFIVEKNKCLNCDDISRENKLLVVENIKTLQKIDDLNAYHYHYYILPYLMNLKDKITKNDYEYHHFVSFLNENNFSEIIIAISPSLEGEMTTTHLLKLLNKLNYKNVSRVAIGLPMNSSIDYLDSYTILQSLENRTKKGK